MTPDGLRVGDRLPDVTLFDASGEVPLRSLVGAGPLVLYFYPRDETPVCTAQACAFRDAYEDFLAAGAQVVGVSSDDAASHARFASRHDLPFRLLEDRGGGARAALGIPRRLGLLPGRVTYVIDREGVVRYTFDSAFRGREHVRRALAEVRKLS